MKKIDMKTDCKTCRTALADLLLDKSYAAAHPEVAAHMAGCAECRKELEELQATFALLDDWKAPEPSPYFDAKLHARLREAQASEPEGFWSRTRAFPDVQHGTSVAAGVGWGAGGCGDARRGWNVCGIVWRTRCAGGGAGVADCD